MSRFAHAKRHVAAFRADIHRVTATRSERKWAALGDTSLWALGLLRGGAAARALVGSGLGLGTALRLVFRIDAWSDDIGGGLRLPHPFGIVIGEGASIGAGCTIMHNVTIQRGAGTAVGAGALLGTGSVVLAGSQVGDECFVGALSVVRGSVPARSVAVGAPARVVRAIGHEESQRSQ